MKGQITISRTSSGSRTDDYVTITISAIHPNKGRVRITLEILEYGRAVVGLAAQPCEVEIRGFEAAIVNSSSGKGELING